MAVEDVMKYNIFRNSSDHGKRKNIKINSNSLEKKSNQTESEIYSHYIQCRSF